MTMLSPERNGTGVRRCPVCQADLKLHRRVTLHQGGGICRLCGYGLESADTRVRISPRQISAWLAREA